MPIVWQKPDGSVALTQLTESFLARERREGEITAEAVARLAMEHIQAKCGGLAGLTPILVKSADMPKERTKRHAWRIKDGKIIVDPTVPDPLTGPPAKRGGPLP